MVTSRTLALALSLLPLLFAAAGARAETCSADDLVKAVDQTGASLRTYNQEAMPKLQAKFRALAAKKGWKDTEADDQAVLALQDERIGKLDETANTLLARIDTLGRLMPGQSPDCAKLEEVRTAGVELIAVMKAKTAYLTTRVDAELGTAQAASAPAPPAKSAPAKSEPPQAVAAGPTNPPAPAASSAPPQKVVPAAAPPPAPKQATANSSWSTTTAEPPAQKKSEAEVAMLPAPGAPYTPGAGAQPQGDGGPRPSAPMLPPPPQNFTPDDGYTVDDIRAATRGFFGSVSTELAAVIEHCFAEVGRPTGYVLGKEGGGAFLGGLRYGEGTLYLREGGTQKIYWHGPSVGFDVGAAGTRIMFLIYKLREPDDLYRTFTGIDGSAFVVGGVGLTLLGGGGMTLAPIRSGVGVRLGANIGYVRFTPTQTWNPF